MDLDEMKSIMKELDLKFCSEKDFQVMLAIKLKDKGYNIICEYPTKSSVEYNPEKDEKNIFTKKASKNAFIDIVVKSDDEMYPIELKYRTSQQIINKAGIEFTLKAQGARDNGSYGFLRDICRIKEFVNNSENKCSKGYVIFLTNDKNYYESSNPFWINLLKLSEEQLRNDKFIIKVDGLYRKLDLPNDIYNYNWNNWLSNSDDDIKYLLFEILKDKDSK